MRVKAHQHQLPETPWRRTMSVTRLGVSLLKVVATMDSPASHHGTDRPETKNSAVFFPARFPKNNAGTKQRSSEAATINQSSAITGGDATLLLKDNAGTTVYSKSLKQNGTFPTIVGVAGNWTIQVLANNVSGTLNFRAQKL